MSLTTDRSDPELYEDRGDGQNKKYLVLSEYERKQGWVRPYRDTYVHDKCGVATHMGRELSETYARDPKFYTHTYCVGSQCQKHFPVSEFKWDDGEVVGS